jgi:hypothetical protein
MRTEKAIAAALEPVVDETLALAARVSRVEELRAIPGEKGEPGRDADPAAVAAALAGNPEFVQLTRGAPGADGAEGIGIDVPMYEPGEVYRKGVHVVAFIGQHFVALKDTAQEPGDPEHWRRVGSLGFRHRGTFDKDAAYVDGDLFTKDHGTFCVVRGEPVLLAGRGLQGGRGDRGERGLQGDKGLNGSTIIGAQVDDNFKLVLVQQNGDGTIDHLEADFAPAYRKLVADALSTAFPELAETIETMRDDIAGLKALQQRRRANG